MKGSVLRVQGTGELKLNAEESIIALLRSPDTPNNDSETAWNSPVNGKTRLVKELFLISKETESGTKGIFSFDFSPGPYGPSSFEVTDAMKNLELAGKINVDKISGTKNSRISLTEIGVKEGENIWKKLPTAVKNDIFSIKSKFKNINYWQLISYVYRAYPSYTVNSLIRDHAFSNTGL